MNDLHEGTDLLLLHLETDLDHQVPVETVETMRLLSLEGGECCDCLDGTPLMTELRRTGVITFTSLVLLETSLSECSMKSSALTARSVFYLILSFVEADDRFTRPSS